MQSRIQGTRHAIKFISGFVLALLKVRSSNLSKVAVAFETGVEFLSTYRQIQRFLGNLKAVKIDYLGLLKMSGKLKVARYAHGVEIRESVGQYIDRQCRI